MLNGHGNRAAGIVGATVTWLVDVRRRPPGSWRTGSTTSRRTRPRCRARRRVELGRDVQRAALGDGAQVAVVEDDLAGLDHVARQREHPPLVVVGRVDRDVAVGAGAEVPLVRQAEHPGRAGAGDDGDLGQACTRGSGRPGPTAPGPARGAA